jgi:hypothetical protein
MISDKPMAEEEWIDAKANVIDVTPEKDDQQRSEMRERLCRLNRRSRISAQPDPGYAYFMWKLCAPIESAGLSCRSSGTYPCVDHAQRPCEGLSLRVRTLAANTPRPVVTIK